ncbi:hypothetical protein OROMI_016060 [Orobanche minor]
METKEREGNSGHQNLITIKTNYSGTTIPITLSPDSTIKDLRSLLQPLTDVLTRGQKLICKGKVLYDDKTLRSLEITHGSKIMLVASTSLHQGSGKKEVPVVSSLRKGAEVKEGKKKNTNISSQVNQSQIWKATGVVALSLSDLEAIPVEVWKCGLSIRYLDVSHNSVRDVPDDIQYLTKVEKLHLNANCIVDDSISWEGISSLRSLTFLSLSQNNITILPSSLGALTSLRQLHVSNNKLISLPTEIGFLTELHVLNANDNRITAVPPCIGNCKSLTEIDLSSNLLVKLPETFGKLHHLKALHLHNNGLRTLPPDLLKNCEQLSSLDVHATGITMDILRQTEGWESFDRRRREKHEKQLSFRLGDMARFDEGADMNFQ